MNTDQNMTIRYFSHYEVTDKCNVCMKNPAMYEVIIRNMSLPLCSKCAIELQSRLQQTLEYNLDM